jgi:hypothetical protein
MNVKDALHELPIARNTKRLLPLWQDIEAKLTAGVSQAEIVALLNDNGFNMTLATFKTYLHRQRKQRQAVPSGTPKVAAPVQAATLAPPTNPGVVAPATSPPISSVKVGATRPPTFDYDPRGIPDLLK